MTGARRFLALIRKKASASGTDNASAADIGLEKTLALVGDTASAADFGLDFKTLADGL